MFILEQGWVRLDTIFASMHLSSSWIAALSQFFILISMLDCFSFGYGFATTSMMTKYLVAGQIKKTKIVAMWSMILIIIVSGIMSSVIACYPDEMANLF